MAAKEKVWKIDCYWEDEKCETWKVIIPYREKIFIRKEKYGDEVLEKYLVIGIDGEIYIVTIRNYEYGKCGTVYEWRESYRIVDIEEVKSEKVDINQFLIEKEDKKRKRGDKNE